MIKAKPFIKWVGGKRIILKTLLANLPDKYDHYYEPFVGGGILFFNIQPLHAHLSDLTPHLITTYIGIRDHVEEIITLIREHVKHHSKEYFKLVGKSFANNLSIPERSAAFIYLNKTCFSGIYRLNGKGEFGSSIGRLSTTSILDEDNFRACSKVLQNVDISCKSFESTEIRDNAFYYLDPPYHNIYHMYSVKKFTEDDHIRLSKFCHNINKAGSYFMQSNSDTSFIRELYKDYNIQTVWAMKYASGSSSRTCKVLELIIKNY